MNRDSPNSPPIKSRLAYRARIRQETINSRCRLGLIFLLSSIFVIFPPNLYTPRGKPLRIPSPESLVPSRTSANSPGAPMTPAPDPLGSSGTRSVATSVATGGKRGAVPERVRGSSGGPHREGEWKSMYSLPVNASKLLDEFVEEAVNEGKSCAEIGTSARDAVIALGVPQGPNAARLAAGPAMRAVASFLTARMAPTDAIIRAASEAGVAAGLWVEEVGGAAREAVRWALVDAVIDGQRAPHHLFSALQSEGYAYVDAVFRATELTATRFAKKVLDGKASTLELLALLQAILSEAEGESDPGLNSRSDTAQRVAMDALAEAAANSGRRASVIVSLLRDIVQAAGEESAQPDDSEIILEATIKAIVSVKFGWDPDSLRRCLDAAREASQASGSVLNTTDAEIIAIDTCISLARAGGVSPERLIGLAVAIVTASQPLGLEGIPVSEYPTPPPSAIHAVEVIATVVAEETLCRGGSLRSAARDVRGVVERCMAGATQAAARIVIKSTTKAAAGLGGLEAEIEEAVHAAVAEAGLNTKQAQVFGVARSVLRSIGDAITTGAVVDGTRRAYTAAEISAREAARGVAQVAAEAAAEGIMESGLPTLMAVMAAREAALATGYSPEDTPTVAAEATTIALSQSREKSMNVPEMLRLTGQIAQAAGLVEEESIRLVGHVATRCIARAGASLGRGTERLAAAAGVLHEASRAEGFGKPQAIEAVRMMAEDALMNQQDSIRLYDTNAKMLLKAAAAAGLPNTDAVKILATVDIRAVTSYYLRNSPSAEPKPVAFYASKELRRLTIESSSAYGPITNLTEALLLAVRATTEAVAAARRSGAEAAAIALAIREKGIHEFPDMPNDKDFFSALAEGVMIGGGDPRMVGDAVRLADEGIEGEGLTTASRDIPALEAVAVVARHCLRLAKPPSLVAEAAYSAALGAGVGGTHLSRVVASACAKEILNAGARANASAEEAVSDIIAAIHALPSTDGARGYAAAMVATNATVNCLAMQALSKGSSVFDPAHLVAAAIGVATIAGLEGDELDVSKDVTEIVLTAVARAASSPSQLARVVVAVGRALVSQLGPGVELAEHIVRITSRNLFQGQHLNDAAKLVGPIMSLATHSGLRNMDAGTICLEEIAQTCIDNNVPADELGIAVKTTAVALRLANEHAARTAVRAYLKSYLKEETPNHPASQPMPTAVGEALDIVAACGIEFPRAARIVAIIAAEETVARKLEERHGATAAVEAARAAALSAGISTKEACHITALVGVRAIVRSALNSGARSEDVARAAAHAARAAGLSAEAGAQTSALITAKEVCLSLSLHGAGPAVVGSTAAATALSCYKTKGGFDAKDIKPPGTVVEHWQATAADALISVEDGGTERSVVAVKELGVSCGMEPAEAAASTARSCVKALVRRNLAAGRAPSAVAALAKTTARLCGLDEARAAVMSAGVVCKQMISDGDPEGEGDDVELVRSALRAVLAIGLSEGLASNVTGKSISLPLAQRLVKQGIPPAAVVARVADAVAACGVAGENEVRAMAATAAAQAVAEGVAARGQPPSEVVRRAMEAAREAGVSDKQARAIVTRVAVRAVVDAAVSRGGVGEICGAAREAGVAVAEGTPSVGDDEIAASVVRAATEALFAAGRAPGEAVLKARSLMETLKEGSGGPKSIGESALVVAGIAARIQAELLVEGGVPPTGVAGRAKEVAVLAGVDYGTAAKIATEATLQAVIHDMVEKDRPPTEIANAATEAASAAALTVLESTLSAISKTSATWSHIMKRCKVIIAMIPQQAIVFAEMAYGSAKGVSMVVGSIMKLLALPFDLVNAFSKLVMTEGEDYPPAGASGSGDPGK